MSQARIWTGSPFPDLSVDWFREFSLADPVAAHTEWQAWLGTGPRADDSKFRKALEVAAGLSTSAVSHYLSQFRGGENRTHHLSAKTLHQLDGVARSLGFIPSSTLPAPPISPPRGARHLAMLTDLRRSPNPRFHLQVIDSIMRCCDMANLFVTIHLISQSDPGLSRTLDRILRQETPRGFIWLRITPSAEALRVVTSFSEALPVIVVHGARVPYPWPVVSHVLPALEKVRELVRLWALAIPGGAGKESSVVVAAMPEEPESSTSTSLRSKRLEMACAGLRDAGKQPVVALIQDYTAAHAYDVVVANPTADGFLCLSDELAVATKHILLAQGKPVADRILGFDGTDLARAQGIPSINQGLNDIGQIVAEEFLAFFRQPPQHRSGFKEVEVDVSLQW